jgi:hypothetical protein
LTLTRLRTCSPLSRLFYFVYSGVPRELWPRPLTRQGLAGARGRHEGCVLPSERGISIEHQPPLSLAVSVAKMKINLSKRCVAIHTWHCERALTPHLPGTPPCPSCNCWCSSPWTWWTASRSHTCFSPSSPPCRASCVRFFATQKEAYGSISITKGRQWDRYARLSTHLHYTRRNYEHPQPAQLVARGVLRAEDVCDDDQARPPPLTNLLNLHVMCMPQRGRLQDEQR